MKFFRIQPYVSQLRINKPFSPNILVFASQFLKPRLFQYLIFVDLGVVTKVETMVNFVGIFGVIGCSIAVDKLRLGSELQLSEYFKQRFEKVSKLNPFDRVKYESQVVRKGAYVFFSLVTILLYAPVATFPCQQWVSLFMVLFANFGMALVLTCATKTIPNEMGGEFSGQVYAVTNTFSNMAGVVGNTRDARIEVQSLNRLIFRSLYTRLFS